MISNTVFRSRCSVDFVSPFGAVFVKIVLKAGSSADNISGYSVVCTTSICSLNPFAAASAFSKSSPRRRLRTGSQFILLLVLLLVPPPPLPVLSITCRGREGSDSMVPLLWGLSEIFPSRLLSLLDISMCVGVGVGVAIFRRNDPLKMTEVLLSRTAFPLLFSQGSDLIC